jgi:hypothetical protein
MIEAHHLEEWRSSCVNDQLTLLNVRTLRDIEVELGGDVMYPIHEILNWKRTRFGHRAQQNLIGWECCGRIKLDQPRLKDGKTIKYEQPVGEDPGLFELQITKQIASSIAQRSHLHTQHSAENFWEQVASDPSVPLIVTEGAKKAGCLLSLGYATIGLPGITMGWRNTEDGLRNLVPGLAKFAAPGRIITICFDRDTKPTTIRAVTAAAVITANLLERAGCRVLIATLPGPQKGVDDTVREQGSDVVHQALAEAKPLAVWRALNWPELTYTSNCVVEGQYLSPDSRRIHIPKKGTIGICAPKGSGKTELLRQATMFDGRVLSIGHRVSLLANLSKRLSLGLYSENTFALEAVGRLAITVDSLYKLRLCIAAAEGDAPNRYDTLVLDEVEQVLLHLSQGSTCKANRQKILAAFEYLVRSAGRVIVADADLSDTSLDYIKALRGEDVYLITSAWRAPGRKVNWFEGKNDSGIVAQLLQDLAENKRLYVFTDSKAVAKRLGVLIAEKLPTLRLRILHGDNSGEKEALDFITHINEQIIDVDCLICTPTLGTGVSIDVRGHFHGIYGLARGVLSATEFSQGLARVRESLPLSIWAVGRGGSRESNPAALREAAIDKERVSGVLLGLEVSLETGKYQATNQPFLTLWSELRARRDASRNNLRTSLEAVLTLEGHQISRIQDFGDIATQEDLSEAHGRIKQIEAEATASAKILTDQEAQRLENRRDRLSEDERHALERRRIEQGYGQAITPELVVIDQGGRLLQKLATLDDLVSSEDVARERDRRDRERHPIITDRGHFSLRRAALVKLGLEEFLNPQREYSQADIERVGEFARRPVMRKQIKKFLGFSIPANASDGWVLGSLWGLLGLKADIAKRGPRKKRERSYKINPESWEFSQNVLEHRQKVREEIAKKEAEKQPLFVGGLEPRTHSTRDILVSEGLQETRVKTVSDPPYRSNTDPGLDTDDYLKVGAWVKAQYGSLPPVLGRITFLDIANKRGLIETAPNSSTWYGVNCLSPEMEEAQARAS